RRTIAGPGHVAHAADSFADDAEARPLAVRPALPVARDAHHDDAGIDRGQRLRGQVTDLERAGTKILDDDIRARRERARDRLAFGRAQVDGGRALVARLHVPPKRGSLLEMAPLAQRIAGLRRLELDDVRAEFGQDLRAERAGDQRTQFEQADAGKRTHAAARHVPVISRSIDETMGAAGSMPSRLTSAFAKSGSRSCRSRTVAVFCSRIIIP